MAFTARNLQANPCLQSNNALRRLILVQGKAGEELLQIFDDVERCGADKFTKEDLDELAKEYPGASEYDRAIELPLFNFITGLAHGRIRYRVGCALGAWRKVFHRYVLPADDLQNMSES